MNATSYAEPPVADDLARKILLVMETKQLSYKEFFSGYDTEHSRSLKIADFTRMVRDVGLRDERSSTLRSTFTYLARTGSINKEAISFYDFLKLFPFQTIAEETSKESQVHKGVVTKLRSALLEKRYTISELLGKEPKTSEIYVKVKGLGGFEDAEDISDLRALVKDVEIKELGIIDLELLQRIIDNIEGPSQENRGLGLVERSLQKEAPVEKKAQKSAE